MHDEDVSPPRRNVEIHPGINFSRLPIEGNIAGLIFVVGSVVALAIGLSAARWFLLLAGAGGLLVGAGLIWWHRRRWLRGSSSAGTAGQSGHAADR